jgi:hypothetical protein
MGFAPESQVRTDSPLEEEGFEPSVPLGREVPERLNKTVSTSGFFFTGDRGFGSASLHRKGMLAQTAPLYLFRRKNFAAVVGWPASPHSQRFNHSSDTLCCLANNDPPRR